MCFDLVQQNVQHNESARAANPCTGTNMVGMLVNLTLHLLFHIVGKKGDGVCVLVGCLTSQQHASVS